MYGITGVAVVCGAILAFNGKEGWGWFIFIAFVALGS